MTDVHQFSIITELLGTPNEELVATICSENVSIDLYVIADVTRFNI